MPSPPQDMLDKAHAALPHAYAPYSQFQVAACVRSHDGHLIASANVENAAYPLSSCAETNAITALVNQGHRLITEVLVLTPTDQPTPPCGACLQRLVEFSDKTMYVHLCTTEGHYQRLTLAECLPHGFSPNHMK